VGAFFLLRCYWARWGQAPGYDGARRAGRGVRARVGGCGECVSGEGDASVEGVASRNLSASASSTGLRARSRREWRRCPCLLRRHEVRSILSLLFAPPSCFLPPRTPSLPPTLPPPSLPPLSSSFALLPSALSLSLSPPASFLCSILIYCLPTLRYTASSCHRGRSTRRGRRRGDTRSG
jgi:hypothetical protein